MIKFYKLRMEVEKMKDTFVRDYINKKIEESKDKNYIKYTFYELRIKNNLSKEDLETFLKINKHYFENNGYHVYFTGEKFVYKNTYMMVQSNELMIAIKE